MTEAGNKRLIIDLEKCDQCDSCGVICDYYQRPHAEDHGMLGLRERATFSLMCRRCEYASCIIACPFDAMSARTTVLSNATTCVASVASVRARLPLRHHLPRNAAILRNPLRQLPGP